MVAKDLHGSMTASRDEIEWSKLQDAKGNREYINAALQACQWEPAGSVQEVTNRFRESTGVWNSSASAFSKIHMTIEDFRGGVDSVSNESKRKVISPQFEVCIAPMRIVTGWDGQEDAGEVEEHVVFTRTRVTIPAGHSFQMVGSIPANVAKPPGKNRFLLLRYDWFVDDNNQLASYPPLHPHHTMASPIGYPAIAGLSAFDPFVIPTMGVEALEQLDAHVYIGPMPEGMCASNGSSSESNDSTGVRIVCDTQFNIVNNVTGRTHPMLLPSGADLASATRIDNVMEDAEYTGHFVSMRQYLLSKPLSRGGAAVTAQWPFHWMMDKAYQLAIPPASGPSFAAHSYSNPKSGLATGNTLHWHPMVTGEMWFITGQHISELVPPNFYSHIHEPFTSKKYQQSGYELSAPSDFVADGSEGMGAMGDVGPVLLDGTGWSVDELKAYLNARLHTGSLRCIWHIRDATQSDGPDVSLPNVLDTRTPSTLCMKVHIDEGTAVTVIAFYDNNTLPDYYGMDSIIQSEFLFDDDPFGED
jgi:hypothetical protein